PPRDPVSDQVAQFHPPRGGTFCLRLHRWPVVWHSRISIDAATWYALPGGRWQLTPAGFWYVLISIPILQFILLRWYVRFFIWFSFSLAGFKDRSQPHSDSSRSRRRSIVPRQECVCLRPYPVRPRNHARGPGGESSSLSGRKLAGFQVIDRWVHRVLRRSHSRSARDVYSPAGWCEKKGLGRLRRARSAVRRQVRPTVGPWRCRPFGGAPWRRRHPVACRS